MSMWPPITAFSMSEVVRCGACTHLMPFIVASLVGSVSAAVLASVGLEVLGLGSFDSLTIGMTLYWVIYYAAIINSWWWWWIPPIVIIIVLFTGHTLSTSTFDLLVWAAVTWLAVRAIRTGQDRLWLLAGAVLGVGLLNKPLPVFLAAGLLAALALCGPRRLLRSRHVWLAAAIAVALWSPWLIWQAAHGWPELAVSRSIAAGGSASSAPWWQIVPFQVLLAGPLLAPVWIAGLVRLFRDPAVRYARFLAWTWVLLAVAFMATGGKPYYLAGLLPALIGAGAAPATGWLDGGRRRARRALLAAVLAASTMAGVLIALPVLPARDAGPVIAVNPDVGETIGWPDLVRTVAAVRHRLPRTAPVVILTENYGEAGAIDRYGPPRGLPHAYSGHNAYGTWPNVPTSCSTSMSRIVRCTPRWP